MNNFNNREGEVYFLKDNVTFATIIKYRGSRDVDVLLSNGIEIKKTTIFNLKNKLIANPLEKNIFGVGYLNVYIPSKLREKAYTKWHGMLERCYSNNSKNKSYSDCFVKEEWHDFSVFLKWFEMNYVEGYDIDKDILIKGNKIYSAETCMFVPKAINNIVVMNKNTRNNIIGVTKSYKKFTAYLRNKYLGIFKTEVEAFNCFKENKEKDIKEIALFFYSNALITTECYDALNRWKIEITD